MPDRGTYTRRRLPPVLAPVVLVVVVLPVVVLEVVVLEEVVVVVVVVLLLEALPVLPKRACKGGTGEKKTVSVRVRRSYRVRPCASAFL